MQGLVAGVEMEGAKPSAREKETQAGARGQRKRRRRECAERWVGGGGVLNQGSVEGFGRGTPPCVHELDNRHQSVHVVHLF